MSDQIKNIISKSIETKQQILNDDEFIKKIENAVDVIVHAFQQGKKVLFCGNGGSAADAQHLAAEFSVGFIKTAKHCHQRLCIATHLI